MKTLLLTIAFCLVAAPAARADARPALPGPPAGARAGQAPPLAWERIIRKCGKPCLLMAAPAEKKRSVLAEAMALSQDETDFIEAIRKM